MTHRQPRALALAALREWRTCARFADVIVHRLLEKSALAVSDRAFATDLVYGVLRNLTLLDRWIGALRRGGVDHDSRDVLRLGLYQLLILNAAEHAAIYETVAVANSRARGLVNAIMRSAQTRRDELMDEAERTPLAARFSHPSFIVDRWTKHFGDTNTAALCAWNNRPPPIYARINQLKISPADFFAGTPGAEPLTAFPNMARLDEFPAAALERGHCYVQDPSTTVACKLLDPQPNETILDACAAPGGKTSYLAELMQNRGRLVAADRDRLRRATLRQNLERLGVTLAEVVQCDWTASEIPPDITRFGPFDRILVDAPCSNTGVMRRRVDVRWRLTPEDYPRMQSEQQTIIQRVLPLLKPGGVLVYSTCSLEPEENADLVAAITQEFPSLRVIGQKCLLPFRDHIDGAFASRLEHLPKKGLV